MTRIRPKKTTKKKSQKTLSIVVPVHNEEDNLRTLNERIFAVIETLDFDVEVIYVDDGSKDAGFEVLSEIASEHDSVRVVQLTRNYGQTAAIAAGISEAEGETIVLMDADLQNDPADIPTLIAKLEEGYDLVSGWRQGRRDPFFTKKLPSLLANRLISYVTGLNLHDYGCTLKAYRREVIKNFRLYGEMHRLLPAYVSQLGARIAELPVRHHPRLHGQSKYGLSRVYKVILDLLTVEFLNRYAVKPLYLFGKVGLLLVVGGVFLVVYLLAVKLLYGFSMIENPLLLVSVMCFILGAQCVFIGLVAELLVRTYHESQDKPIYMVRCVLGGKR